MIRGLLLAPAAPPVNISPNKGFLSGITAWFTQEHLVALAVAVIVTVFVWKCWKMIISHPVIFAVLIIIGLVIGGFLTLKHPAGQTPAPIVPLPKGH